MEDWKLKGGRLKDRNNMKFSIDPKVQKLFRNKRGGDVGNMP